MPAYTSDGFELPPLPGEAPSADQPLPAPELTRQSAAAPAANDSLRTSDGYELPPLPGGAQAGGDDISAVKEAGRGFVHGLTNMAGAVNTAIEYAGVKSGSEGLQEFGRHGAEYWEDVGEDWEAPEALQGSVVDQPGLLKDPAWWAYNVSSFVPSFAASVIPGVGAARGIQFMGKAYKLNPDRLRKLARIGGTIVGGFTGGSLEGAGTYREVLKKGGTKEEAADAAELMTAASAALNMLSVERFLRGLPEGAVNKLKARTLRGLTEGITEYLEGPAEALIMFEGEHITPEEAIQKIKDELNVLGPAAVTGFFFPGAGTLPTVEQGRKNAAEDQPPAEEQPPAGVQPPTDTAPLPAEDVIGEEEPASIPATKPEMPVTTEGDQDQTGAVPGVGATPEPEPDQLEIVPPAPEETPPEGAAEPPDTKGVTIDATKPEPSKAPPVQENVPEWRKVDAETDDILAAVAKLGGISREEAEAQGIDPAEFNRRGFRFHRVFTKNGAGFDSMAEKLSQFGYPVTNDQGRYDVNTLLDSLDRALRGIGTRTPQGMENLLEQQEEQRLADYDYQQEMEGAGLDMDDINDLAEAYAEINVDPNAGDLTELRAEYNELLGDDVVDAIIERIGIQEPDLSDAEFVTAIEQELRGTYEQGQQQWAPEDLGPVGQAPTELAEPPPGPPISEAAGEPAAEPEPLGIEGLVTPEQAAATEAGLAPEPSPAPIEEPDRSLLEPKPEKKRPGKKKPSIAESAAPPTRKPLKDILFKEEAEIEETGERVVIEQSAEVLLRQIDKRLANLQKLRDCVTA